MKKSRNGSALLTVVILAAAAVVLAGALFFAGGAHIRRTESMVRFEHAFFIAESGIQLAASELLQDGAENMLAGPDNTADTADDEQLTIGPSVNYANGTLDVTVVDAAGLDDTVIVTSVGMYQNKTRTIEAMLQLEDMISPPLTGDGALAVYGDSTKADVMGFATIDGSDRDLPENWPNVGIAGEGTVNTNLPMAPGVYSAVTSTVVNIDGSATVLGNPAQLVGSGSYTEDDYVKLAQQLIPLATHVLEGGVYAGNNIYGTRDNPVITVVSGDSKFAGSADGAGVLIITAGMEIDFAGTFNFEGLIIVIGGGIVGASYEFEDKGNCTLLGSVVCVGDELDMKLTGSSLVGYSSAALANLVNIDLPDPKVSYVYWKEIK